MSRRSDTGTLFLLPAPLGGEEQEPDTIPAASARPVLELHHFVVEEERPARRYLKKLGVRRPVSELHLRRLNEHTPLSELDELLEPLLRGEDMALVSEAGCPCVADPGSELVRRAHQAGITVKPLVGPSSILLALMASGLNGQNFAFVGYLPTDKEARGARIKELERRSACEQQTQIFMETPYRGQKLAAEVLRVCRAGTRLCIAADLTTPNEQIRTRRIEEWRRELPVLGKSPAMFLLQGESEGQ